MWCPDTLLMSASFLLSIFSELAVVCVFVPEILGISHGDSHQISVCARLWQSVPPGDKVPPLQPGTQYHC